jgi:hypothetical protein
LRLLCDIALRLIRKRLDPLCRGVVGPDDGSLSLALPAAPSPATLASLALHLVWVGVCSCGDRDSDSAMELGRRRLFDGADDVTDHDGVEVVDNDEAAVRDREDDRDTSPVDASDAKGDRQLIEPSDEQK